MHMNLFPEGCALVEPAPQGDSSIPLQLSAEAEQVIALLIPDDQAAAAIAAVFLEGVRVGERAAVSQRRPTRAIAEKPS